MGPPVPVSSLADLGLRDKQRTLSKLTKIILLYCLFISQFHEIQGLNPKLFPYGLDQSDLNLPRDVDDVSSPELRLQTPVVFYGKLYPGVYINQNGLVSFMTDIPAFVNMQFPLDYPTIAPFYSDVDTRISGTVYYRETQSEELLERARTTFSDHFTSAVNFQPSSLLIVTWDNVGYYDRKSDKVFQKLLPPESLRPSDLTNTYQLVIGSDGGDSYVVFLYDQIEWIQGTGKNPSQVDAKAQAGLISGHGPHHSLKGSGTDQVSNIYKRSNANEDGVWMFRMGRVGEKLEEPDLNVILESSSESSSTCAAGGVTNCHSQASCVDYEPGYCCKCTRGYYGNGRVCLQDEAPVRINGKVKGVLNGVALEDSDLFSYILPQDGRAYTAYAKISERLGYDLQTVITLGTSIGWLFSTSVKGAPNGFMLTGGTLNYTSDINFQQTGQKVQIHQNFLGLDVFSHMRVETRIHGTAPLVPVGKQIEVNDVKMEFTRVSPGIIRSRSTHAYVVEGTSQENPFTVDQTIEYEECPWASPFLLGMETITMKVGRNYIIYDLKEHINRFAITSIVSPVDGDDPCKDNKDKCGRDSSCVVEGDSYRCICNLGYEQRYNYEQPSESREDQSPPECVDLDECQIGTSTCDVTAVCYNSPGSYSCQCQPGYSGDGYVCTKILSCADVQCGPNANCMEVSVGNPECRCLPGFFGDGLFCYEPTGGGDPNPGSAPDCRQVRNLCDPFAECVFSSSSNSYVCSCQPGYNGDGMMCHRETPTDEESCDIINNCHRFSDCRLDEVLNEYTCVCKNGYVGDGYSCKPSHEHGSSYPDGSAERPPQPICVLGACYCSNGYYYDDIREECTFSHSELSSAEQNQCDQEPSQCDSNASCLYQDGKYQCVCNHGFGGSGRECTPQDYCSSHSECSPYGECAYDSNELRYSCRCRDGFLGDGKECRPKADVGCDVLRNCHADGQCSWDASQAKYACECGPGFRGDGLTCQEDILGCNVLQNCGNKSECVYDPQAKGYRCQCKAGFQGDGYRCRSTVPCYQDKSICDSNAECHPDSETREWKCQCKQGFLGDGQQCKEATTSEDGDQLIVAKGMSLIKITLSNSRTTPLTVEPFQTAIGIDFDCLAQKIYWSDVATRAIKMGNFNGSEKGAFLDDGIGSPEGLGIDWASGNIYWTDSLKDTIEVASLKTKLRRTIISTGLVNPRGIAVYPLRGRLFWSDWNRDYPKIEYSRLDGEERQILVGEGLALPNSLVIDLTGDQLCWADAGTHKIECVGIDGRNRRPHVMQVQYPFGLALGPENFYWSDWETKRVESASRQTGERQTSYEVSLGGNGKLYGLVFIPAQCSQAYSPCQHDPCGADRICLPNVGGRYSEYFCLCADDAPPSCQNLQT